MFSVDIHSTDIDSARNFWLESLVECKYRHDGTKWVFTPHEYYAKIWGPDFQDLFVTLDQCCLDRKLNQDSFSKWDKYYPLCGKGIELLPEDSNPKTIEQAVQQLCYGVVAKAIDALRHQADELLGCPTPIFVIVPIIVTTAELWRLKVGTTVEDIRNAKEIEGVAESHDILVLTQQPDNLDAKHTQVAFQESLSASQTDKLSDLFQQTTNGTLPSFVEHFASNFPSLFIIISYKGFRTEMTKLREFFAKDSVVQSRI